ncbi:hypothetical protein OL548_20985 [Lysinibacillus sp. MHQ-1]|nr:hypothetical protein OL548_20985 [Lysinibacillus sp. MHQ-1]
MQQAQLISLTMGGNDVMKVVKQDLFNLKRDAFDKELRTYKQRYSKIVEGIRAKKSDSAYPTHWILQSIFDCDQ